LIIPAQFGMRHRGRSIRRTRKVLELNEFGLDVFSVGCMLLTHPERLSGQPNELYVDCAGDEYSREGDGSFTCSLCFGRINRSIYFYAVKDSHAGNRFGSASGFLL